MEPLRIGIDFDNTIACYDGVFHKAAAEKQWIPENLPPSKTSVRDYLRSIGKEEEWTELQGWVYGSRMDLAHPYPGIESFFSLCASQKIPAFIISHKTLHPYRGPLYDLHGAAHQWLKQLSAHPPAFFELTLEKKIQRISDQKCTVFIDDLPELLAEKTFPKNVLKILFDPNDLHRSEEQNFVRARSWNEIIQILRLTDYGS